MSSDWTGTAPHPEDTLPDPPDNPEFLEMFTPEQQSRIDRRFQSGIRKNEAAVHAAAERVRAQFNRDQDARERRRLAYEKRMAARFNPVLRYRP